jgi:energy-coupling factor transport system permease protein
MSKRKRGFFPDVSVLHNILGSVKSSWLQRMDPRTKILWFIISFVTGLIILEHLAALTGLLIYIFILGAAAHVTREQLVMMKVVIPLAVIVFLANLLLIPAAGKTAYAPIVDFGVKYPWYYIFPSFTNTRNIAITWESLYIGMVRGMVVFTLSGVAAFFILIIDLTELVEGMHLLKVPYKFAFTVGLAINYIPILFFDLSTVSEAQRARGHRLDRGGIFRKIKASSKLILPVINCAYMRTGRIADAMMSRGFGASNRRGIITEYRMSKRDYSFLAVSISLLAIFIVVRMCFPIIEVRMKL